MNQKQQIRKIFAVMEIEEMDDLISRRAAIDALKEHRALYCDNTPDTFSKLSYAEKSRVNELDTAIATLINLPSAQPETLTANFVREMDGETIEKLKEGLKNAPVLIMAVNDDSAQPERKKGKWILVKGSNGKDYHKCSKCLHTQEITGVKNYCAVCGADMMGD